MNVSNAETAVTGSEYYPRSGVSISVTLLWGVLVIAVLALPQFLGAYGVRVGGTMLMFIALAQSWNLSLIHI